jgi:hypothetical protein
MHVSLGELEKVRPWEKRFREVETIIHVIITARSRANIFDRAEVDAPDWGTSDTRYDVDPGDYARAKLVLECFRLQTVQLAIEEDCLSWAQVTRWIDLDTSKAHDALAKCELGDL